MHPKLGSLMGDRHRQSFLTWWRVILCSFWSTMMIILDAKLLMFTATMCLSKYVTMSPCFYNYCSTKLVLGSCNPFWGTLDMRQIIISRLPIRPYLCFLWAPTTNLILLPPLSVPLRSSAHELLLYMQEVLLKRGCVWHFVKYDQSPEFAKVGSLETTKPNLIHKQVQNG